MIVTDKGLVFVIYIACAFRRFEDALEARRAILSGLPLGGVRVEARWIDAAVSCSGNEPRDNIDARRALAGNDADLARADAVLVLEHEPNAGRATYGEARCAIALGKPVVWLLNAKFVASLDMYRPGVARVNDLDEAVSTLRELAREAVRTVPMCTRCRRVRLRELDLPKGVAACLCAATSCDDINPAPAVLPIYACSITAERGAVTSADVSPAATVAQVAAAAGRVSESGAGCAQIYLPRGAHR